MKNQLNIRISDNVRMQLDELTEALNDTQTSVISTAIDRMWKEEIPMFKRASQKLQVNDLIACDGSTGFDHGCYDFAVFRYLGDGQARAIKADNCTSCWQVGHDQGHIFAEVGETYQIDLDKVRLATGNFRRDVAWEIDRFDFTEA